jgi:ABC-type branched-subunit amino acid transport system substrate-binding protein
MFILQEFITSRLVITFLLLQNVIYEDTFAAELIQSNGKSKIAIVLNLNSDNATESNYATANSFWINQGLVLGIENIKKKYPELEYEYFNDQGTIKGALDIAEKIKKNPNIQVVISGYSSTTSVPLAKKLKEQNLFNVFASAKDSIANVNKHGRLVSDNDHQGKKLLEFATKGLNSKKPCFIFSLNDGFSLQVKRGITETEIGKKIPIYPYRNESLSEIEAAVKGCHHEKSDIILHSGISTSARILLNFHSRQENLIPVVGTDGWGDIPKVLSNQTIENMKSRGLKLYFLYYWDDQPRTANQKAIAQKFQLKYKDTISTITALGYDAAIISADFVKAKKMNPKLSISEFLRNGVASQDLVLFNKKRINAPLQMNAYEIKTNGSFERAKEDFYQ